MGILTLGLTLLALAHAGGAAAAEPFDQSDVGTYGLIHRDGHLTDQRYRLRKTDRWKVENRNADGSWEDVTCETECLLKPSTARDISYFMQGEPPPGITTQCMHNMAFAFCRVMGPEAGQRRYFLIALIRSRPITMKLQRMQEPD